MQQDPGVYKPHRDTREDVIAALRELMKLGKDDPAPQPPPLPDATRTRKTRRTTRSRTMSNKTRQ